MALTEGARLADHLEAMPETVVVDQIGPPRPGAAERDPSSPRYWEWTRQTPGEMAVGPTISGWFLHSLKATAYLLQQCGAPKDGAGRAILDVSAGSGALGGLFRQAWPAITYHATEQSESLLDACRRRAEPESATVWKCGPDTPPDGLRQQLGSSREVFCPVYDLVVLNHVLDCVPYPITYRLLDCAWEMVRPHDEETGRNGFLLVNVQRHLTHRVHPVPWDWDLTIGHLAQYSRPVLAFDDAIGGNLLAAIWKPPLGTPTYSGPESLVP